MTNIKDIQPEYKIATVRCACGNTFEAGSVKDELKVEILILLNRPIVCEGASEIAK